MPKLGVKPVLPFTCLLHSSPSSLNSQPPHMTSLIKPSFESSSSITTSLLLHYFTNSQLLFSLPFNSSADHFNSTLKNFSESQQFDKVLNLYLLLRLSNLKPDHFTFPYVLKACARTAHCCVKDGETIHSLILRSGYQSNVFVGNSLIDMYSKFGFVLSSRKMFDEMPEWNLVSWNMMVSGYGMNGLGNEAMELCELMKLNGMRLDRVGLKIILPICSQLGEIGVGKSIHAYIIVNDLGSDTTLGTALLDMYAKCGNMSVAERVFSEIVDKDIVSWNAMINGYLQCGQLYMVLALFHQVQIENVRPSIVTVLVTLQACADLAGLHCGESIHGFISKLGLDSDSSVENLLINMYSKCGKLNLAYKLFDGLRIENVNSWSIMIHGLGMHGYGEAALMEFFRMLKRGIKPDSLCFLVVLSCCSHTGLVKEGRKIFYCMVEQFGIEPKMEHYVSMVDLIGRVGLIDEAYKFIKEMPIEPDATVWGAFLGACRIHGNFQMGKWCGELLNQISPETSGYYKLLMSIYTSKGSWDELLQIRNLMSERGVQKALGTSLIETCS